MLRHQTLRPQTEVMVGTGPSTYHIRFLQRTSDTELARYKGVSCNGSGDWLNALPSSNLRLEMSDDCIRISAGLRLGSPVIIELMKTNEKFGIHALIYSNIRSRQGTCHKTCNKVTQEALKPADVPSTLEPQRLLRDDVKRRDGVSLLPWC